MSERWLQETIDTEGSCWKSEVAILDPKRNWTHAANTSEAERIANRAVLDTIVRARHCENPEAAISALLQIAQNVSREALTPGKHDQRGKHRLTAPDTTIDQLLERLPIFRWPRAGANGC
jgi:hypothetical protein